MDTLNGAQASSSQISRTRPEQLDLSKLDPRLLDSFDPVAQKHLIDGNYHKFLLNVLPTHGEVPPQVLDILPYLGFLKDNTIHRRVQDFFMQNMENPDVNPNSLTESRYNYIMNAGFGSRFIPQEWFEEFCDEEGPESYLTQSRVPKNQKQFVFTLQNLATHRMEVEKSVFVHQHTSGKVAPLSTIAQECLNGMPFWKLGPLPNRDNVYALYYVGTKPLYKGYFPASMEIPIYIGTSRHDSSQQLLILRHKTSNLSISDFCVRIMIVDNRHYRKCLRGMLVEHFNPLWNNKIVGLNFEKVTAEPDNLWVGYHIKQNPKALQIVDTNVGNMPNLAGTAEEKKCIQQ